MCVSCAGVYVQYFVTGVGLCAGMTMIALPATATSDCLPSDDEAKIGALISHLSETVILPYVVSGPFRSDIML